MDVVLIPAYKPDDKLIKLVEAIHREKFKILIVDDGSGEEYREIFETVSRYAKVIVSPENEGKGNALKRGMRGILEYYPECSHFITADSDGQHTLQDIIRVREKLAQGSSMVLTVRNLKGNIPARSMVGNIMSRWIYTVLTGHYLPDNQSGLRGFNTENIEWLLKVKGSKYDYEINVIYYADKQHIKIDELPIDAVYFDGNISSHFSPLQDTVRIYKRLLTSAAASLISVIICAVAMAVISVTVGYRYCIVTIPLLGIAVTLLSIAVNRYIFRNVNYRDGSRTLLSSAIRFMVYTAVCFFAGIYIPQVPIVVAFIITAALTVPAKYLIHKCIAIQLRK